MGHADIGADVTGNGDFEFVEVANTTDAPIDPRQGWGVSYIFNESGTSASDKPLTVTDATAVVPARGVALLWLQYASGAVDSFARTDAQFRTAVGAAPDAQVLHLTGQPGIANGGNRGIRIDAAGTPLTWSFVPARTATPQASTHFGVPASGGGLTRVTADLAPSTAGTVDPTQLLPPSTGPVDPTRPPRPARPCRSRARRPRQTRPSPRRCCRSPRSPPTRPTSALPTATSSSRSIAPPTAWSTSPTTRSTTSSPTPTRRRPNATLWPARPADNVIAPGRTLVVWVKNGQNTTS